MPDKDKKKVKIRPGYNPRTNAMRNHREGALGSGTRQGKANRGGQGLKMRKEESPEERTRKHKPQTTKQKNKHKDLKMAPMPTRSKPIKPKDNKPVWV